MRPNHAKCSGEEGRAACHGPPLGFSGLQIVETTPAICINPGAPISRRIDEIAARLARGRLGAYFAPLATAGLAVSAWSQSHFSASTPLDAVEASVTSFTSP